MPYKLRFGGAFFFDSKGSVSSPPFPVKVRWRPASGPPGTAKWGPGFGSCRRRYSARSQGTRRTVRGQRPGGRARTRRGSFHFTRPIRGQCGSACPLRGGNSACQQAEMRQRAATISPRSSTPAPAAERIQHPRRDRLRARRAGREGHHRQAPHLSADW